MKTLEEIKMGLVDPGDIESIDALIRIRDAYRDRPITSHDPFSGIPVQQMDNINKVLAEYMEANKMVIRPYNIDMPKLTTHRPRTGGPKFTPKKKKRK